MTTSLVHQSFTSYIFVPWQTRLTVVLREQMAPAPLLLPPASHDPPSCVGHMQKHVVKEPQLSLYISHGHSNPDCQFMCIFTIRTPSHLLDRAPDIAFPKTDHNKTLILFYYRTYLNTNQTYCYFKLNSDKQNHLNDT